MYVYMHEHMYVESGGLQKHFAPPLLAWNLPIRLASKPQGSSHLYHLSTGVASTCHHRSQHFYMGSGDLTQVIMLERQEFTYQMIYFHGPLFFNIIFFFPPTTLSSNFGWIFPPSNEKCNRYTHLLKFPLLGILYPSAFSVHCGSRIIALGCPCANFEDQ